MKEVIEGYSFDFPNAQSITKFDGKSHKMTHAMKAVDVVIELPEYRLYVEVKSFEDHEEWRELMDNNCEKKKWSKELRFGLVYKFRDSILYHWCQEKDEKKNMFLFLTDWQDSALVTKFGESLHNSFPLSKHKDRWASVWQKSFVDAYFVLTAKLWNMSKLNKLGTITKM